MAFNPSGDIRSILVEVGDPVTISGGMVVYAQPGTASTDDSLNGGDSIVAGRTKTLAFSASDAQGIEAGKTLGWAGRTWRVVHTALRAKGSIFIAFLGAP